MCEMPDVLAAEQSVHPQRQAGQSELCAVHLGEIEPVCRASASDDHVEDLKSTSLDEVEERLERGGAGVIGTEAEDKDLDIPQRPAMHPDHPGRLMRARAP